MSTKTDAKKRAIRLKKLREAHQDSVTRTQALLKEQKAIRGEICLPMRESPRTVPEIASLTDLPADQVLWHITAMKKYDLIEEAGMCGEYYLYQLPAGSKK
jgi:predicted transcriptional regulator